MQMLTAILQMCTVLAGFTPHTPLQTIEAPKATEIRNCVAVSINCHMQHNFNLVCIEAGMAAIKKEQR